MTEHTCENKNCDCKYSWRTGLIGDKWCIQIAHYLDDDNHEIISTLCDFDTEIQAEAAAFGFVKGLLFKANLT